MAAQFDVRVDSTNTLFFAARPEAPLDAIDHPEAKRLRGIFSDRYQVSPQVAEKIQEYIRQHETAMGKLCLNTGALFCCCMSAFVDQTAAWDFDRDTAEVRKHVVMLLSEVLNPDDYDLWDSSSLPEKRMFNPDTGGIVVLKLFIKKKSD